MSKLSVPTDKGANAGLKVTSLVAGMIAGADSIDDMALPWHGAMNKILERALRAVLRGRVCGPGRSRCGRTCVGRYRSRSPWLASVCWWAKVSTAGVSAAPICRYTLRSPCQPWYLEPKAAGRQTVRADR